MSIVWSPENYSQSACIAEYAELEMLSRLEWMTLKPKVILDVGAGLGRGSAALKMRYKEALVISLDGSLEMLQVASQHHPNQVPLCGFAENLPFAAQSVDLIFANLVMPWSGEIEKLLLEWHRVLRKEGLMMFSTFGMQTGEQHPFLQSLSSFPNRTDIQALGDALVKTKWCDPVLDRDQYTLSYREMKTLVHELYATGMCEEDALSSHSMQSNEMTYELLYAHAFLQKEKEAEKAEASVFPLSALRQQLRQVTEGRK